jgi:hypothetical protein
MMRPNARSSALATLLVMLCLGAGRETRARPQQGGDFGRDQSAWSRRPAGAGEYQTVAELSGRNELSTFFEAPKNAANLAALCQARTRAFGNAVEVMDTQLAAMGGGVRDGQKLVQAALLHASLGQLYSYEGKMAETIEHLEAAYRIVAENPGLHPEFKTARLFLEEALGVANLRRGELENCVHDHNADRCIFPLSVAAQHGLPSGSEQAVVYFTKHLDQNPENLEVRWLLNLAYMTLGRYPGAVPKEHLIPPSALESKQTVGRFVDVAPSLGLDRLATAGGAIVDDFDGDRLLDVVISSVAVCDSLRYYRNNGDGTFSDLTARANLADQLGGINCVQTDYNNDGRLDIYVMRGGWEFAMPNSLLRNNGDGTFSDVTSESGIASAAHRTHSAAWADFDNDGWVDLFIGHEETPSQLFRNRGDGTFADVSRASGVDRVAFTKGAAWGDYDNDDYPDLYVSNFGDDNFLFHNNRDGTFTEVGKQLGVEKPLMSFPTWFWDYDNDGWLDIFVASYIPSVTEIARGYLGLPAQAETMKLYRNTGNGAFEDVTKAVGLDRVVPSMGANFGDLDNDGFHDFYLGTGAPSYASLLPNFMFRNGGGTRFVDVTSSTGTGHLQKGHGIAFGDVDNDGDQDVYLNVGGFVPGDSYNKVLFANPGQGNNWISIRLVGTKTNRAAIGAKVKLVLADGPGRSALRYREVSSGGSYGASTLAREIGLGKATRIESLEVWWPASKTRQTFRDVGVNQFIEIKESEKDYVKRPVRPFAMKSAAKAPAHPASHRARPRRRP